MPPGPGITKFTFFGQVGEVDVRPQQSTLTLLRGLGGQGVRKVCRAPVPKNGDRALNTQAGGGFRWGRQIAFPIIIINIFPPP